MIRRRDNFIFTRRPPRNAGSPKKILAGVLLVIAFLLIFRRPLTEQAFNIAVPLWNIEHRLANFLLPVTSGWVTTGELAEENSLLKDELAERTAEHNEQKEIIRELRTRLELFDDYALTISSGTPTIAKILVRPPHTPFDTLVLDKGAPHGITTGNLVFAPGNILLGKIAESLTSGSKASLLSSSGEKNLGFVEGIGVFELTGMGGGNFTFTTPKDSTPEEGSIVWTEDSRHIFAIVGTSTPITNEATALVRAQAPFNIQNLRWVNILRTESAE